MPNVFEPLCQPNGSSSRFGASRGRLVNAGSGRGRRKRVMKAVVDVSFYYFVNQSFCHIALLEGEEDRIMEDKIMPRA